MDIIEEDKVQGFFSFIVNYVGNYKKRHCRKIKLID
jgi:hypothetical protein